MAGKCWIIYRWRHFIRGAVGILDFDDLHSIAKVSALWALETYDPARGSEKGYVFATTKFALQDEMRMHDVYTRDESAKLAKGGEDAELLQKRYFIAHEKGDAVFDRSSEIDLDELCIRKELLDKMLDVIDRMKGKRKKVLRMVLDGKQKKEAAYAAGISPGRVNQYEALCLYKFSRKIGERFDGHMYDDVVREMRMDGTYTAYTRSLHA